MGKKGKGRDQVREQQQGQEAPGREEQQNPRGQEASGHQQQQQQRPRGQEAWRHQQQHRQCPRGQEASGHQQQHRQCPRGQEASGHQQQQQQQQQQRPQGQEASGHQQQQQQRPRGQEASGHQQQQQQQQQQRPQGQEASGHQQQQQQRPRGQEAWRHRQQQQQRPRGQEASGHQQQQQQQQRPQGQEASGHQQQHRQCPRGQEASGHQQQQQQQQRPQGQEAPGHQQQQQQRPRGQEAWRHQQQQQQHPRGQEASGHQQQQQQQQRPQGQEASGHQQQQQQQQQQRPRGQEASGRREKQQPQEIVPASTGTSTKNGWTSELDEKYAKVMPWKSGPNGGTLGKRIQVLTNMLRIAFSPNFQMHIVHYDVVIEPEKWRHLYRDVFEEFRKRQCPNRHPAFDGRKNAYSSGHLPFGERSPVEEITISDPESIREKTFRVHLAKAADIDVSWLKDIKYGFLNLTMQKAGIQALDIILRHGAMTQHIPVGRSLFPKMVDGPVRSLTHGLDLRVGIFQSFIVGSRPYLNVDVAHKGFPTSQSVINLMKEFCMDPRSRTLPSTVTAQDVRRNQQEISSFLKGLKVQYEIPGQPGTKRIYRVNDLVTCARDNKFQLEDQTTCTVEQYFSRMKNYKVQYPDLPCLWVGSRNSKIHVPAELCTIAAGQVTNKKMDSGQTSAMIRAAATDTNVRKEKIMRGFATMDLNRKPVLSNEFQFSIQTEFEKVPARVLQPPMLQYSDKNINVFKGTWNVNKFFKPCSIPENTWTILNLDSRVCYRELYDGLHNQLQRTGCTLNMSIGKAQTPFVNLQVRRDNRDIKSYFEEKKKQELRLVIVIIPNIPDAYSVVKQISELSIPGGIVTQCIKSQTLRKLSDSTISNILLKINSKLNGVNHTLASSHRPPCLNVPCMIIGADVTHPSPQSTDIPSIAAVAASHSANAFEYNIEISLQSPREEMIQDLERIIMGQLMYFTKKTGRKPLKIIFYRDGVSDSQLEKVLSFEVSAIKRAVQRLSKDSELNIPITFLVVQKRHHTRFFPTDRRNSDDRNYNVQAGTIVDTEITHPTHIDFYLVSHASIQGTARPTKYRCICNENNMTEDEIEQLTYYLCHLFARCTRSVSYPAPTYYAHLAAFRARALIQNVPLNLENLEEEQRKKVTLQINKNSPMFFV